MLLSELHLVGRRFTWSNQRQRPTLERIDRAFATVNWLDAFPNHLLRCLSSDCSDHSPLLLQLDTEPWAKPRFRFENFWTKLVGFQEVVAASWVCPLANVDACRVLDYKFRNTAKCLKSWSMKQVGSVRLQLLMARELIAQFDAAQESRALTVEEHELRAELKLKTLGLASLSRSIVRQHAKIRNLQEGDANTRFFHLQACHRNRKSFIPDFEHSGAWFSENEAKSEIIFEYFNGIMGKPFTRSHSLNLQSLNLPSVDLNDLEVCFTTEEIWCAIKELPGDRAPGPDGFTGLFYKVCWEVIKDDIVNAFNALWSLDGRSFFLLNGGLMVLLRKTDAPSKLKDFRPISLMHSFSKLFAKVLARRLAPKLNDIVNANQSAFIKGRSIHDNFRSVQLACRWLHKRKFPAVLLKIDLAKAFDLVAWPFLLEVLQFTGFPSRWREWVSLLLSSANTKVIVNGRPGRRIAHARGLRQGDPLSLMLFVLAMEVLNALLAEADRRALMSPLPGTAIRCRTSLYADDIVIFVAPKSEDFRTIQAVLDLFAGASGLITNVDKCQISPIQCNEDDISRVLSSFPCQLVPFPCKYLGVPLSIFRLKKSDEQALVDKIGARIPTWKSGLMTNAGRVLLTKVTLSAIPVHISISACLSSWAIKQIDKRRRAFLWAGSDTVSGGKCKVAWVLTPNFSQH